MGLYKIPENMRTLSYAEAKERYDQGKPIWAMNKSTGDIEEINQYPWNEICTAWHCNHIGLLAGIKAPIIKLKTGPVDTETAELQLKLYQLLRNGDLGTDIRQSGTIHKLYEQVNADKEWMIDIPYSHPGRSLDNIEAMEWLIEQYDLEEYIIDDSDTSITVSAPEDHRVLTIQVAGAGTEFEHTFFISGEPKTPETLGKDIEILRKRQEETEKLIVQKYILREHRILFPDQN